MTDVTKSNISSVVAGVGFVLAAPFVAVAALVLVPSIYLSEKIHSCKYGPTLYDSNDNHAYVVCKTCGARMAATDESF